MSQSSKKAFVPETHVYLAIACKAEYDHHCYHIEAKENFDQKILGVFWSRTAANLCAQKYAYGDEMDDDDDECEQDDDDDEEELFSYDGGACEEGLEEGVYKKVWVARQKIKDAK